jgi:hypothetical protein
MSFFKFKNIFALSSLILLISITFAYYNLKEPTYFQKVPNSEQHEIILSSNAKTNVLTEDGKLSLSGWSKHYHPFHFNPEKMNPSTSPFKIFNKLRYKKWEAFVLIHKDFILGTGIFDVSYLGGYMFHFADLTNHTNKEIYAVEGMDVLSKPFIADMCYQNCKIAEYKKKEISYLQSRAARMSNQFLFTNYTSDKLNISLDLNLHAQDYESLVTLTPISNDSSLWYWNTKTYTIKAKGKIKINNKEYNSDDLYLAYDTGRGVWPLLSGWIWVSANGKSENNEIIGLNFGHGFNHPESSRHTEDSFFVDGKIFKLNSVESKKLDSDVMSKWEFVSKSDEKIKNKCRVIFTPAKNVGNVGSEFLPHRFNVKYGVYSGECVEESGKVHRFSIWGIMEDKLSLW